MNMETFIQSTRNGYLKPKKDKDGYLNVCLAGKNKTIYVRIATLVAYNFIGKPPRNIKDLTVDHIDKNILNNHYKNLRWLERSENTRRATCISQNGEKNNQAILKESQVVEICKLLMENKLSLKNIGNLYNVSKFTISNIRRKAAWKHITSSYVFPNINVGRDRKGRFLRFGSTGK